MNLTEYVKESRRTFTKLETVEMDMFHLESGITSEYGEIIDILKRNVAYQKEIDINHLKEEIGDYFWYVANLIYLDEQIVESEIEEIFNMWNMYQNSISSEILGKPFYEVIPTFNEQNNLTVVLYLVKLFNLELEEILHLNIEKLKVRFPDGFTKEKALTRDLKKEDIILNK